MRISFLLHNGYHYGGTIRTTFTLAEELAERHEVEIVSVFRHRDRPLLGLPGGVTLRHLVDLRLHLRDQRLLLLAAADRAGAGAFPGPQGPAG
ncbi:hypothetical protein ABZ054_34325, partial [Streptomyces sp. NPDC006324]